MSTLRTALARLPDGVFADLLASEDAYLVVLDLPGATDETVDVRVSGGRVHVEARRAKDAPSEFEYVSEERELFLDITFPLPPDATPEGADASIQRGVLELRLPRRSGADREIPLE